MSLPRSSHDSSPHNLSDLLRGSVPDHQSPEIDNSLRSRLLHADDPFSSPPPSLHPSWRAVHAEPPGEDGRGIQGVSTTRSVAIHYSPTSPTHAVKRFDNVGHKPEDLTTTKKASYDRPLRRLSLEESEVFSKSPSGLTHEPAEAGHPAHYHEPGRSQAIHQARRRPLNQDEFDGPIQLLLLPPVQEDQIRAQALPDLPIHLSLQEQDEVMRISNDVLSSCAFHFIAKYQFPIPLERDKSSIRQAFDRDWTEWAYLLKRLATKRRIPSRVLHENQIKSLVTVLENSIPIRSTRSRDSQGPEKAMRDDRYVLQLVSAGIQVARLLMDSLAMQELSNLYDQTEAVILERR